MSSGQNVQQSATASAAAATNSPLPLLCSVLCDQLFSRVNPSLATSSKRISCDCCSNFLQARCASCHQGTRDMTCYQNRKHGLNSNQNQNLGHSQSDFSASRVQLMHAGKRLHWWHRHLCNFCLCPMKPGMGTDHQSKGSLVQRLTSLKGHRVRS